MYRSGHSLRGDTTHPVVSLRGFTLCSRAAGKNFRRDAAVAADGNLFSFHVL